MENYVSPRRLGLAVTKLKALIAAKVDASKIINNDSTTVAGYVADARIVKAHGDEIDAIRRSFQDGCNTIVAGCTSYGATPASNSPAHIVAAIKKIWTDRYNSGISAGKSSVAMVSLIAANYTSLFNGLPNTDRGWKTLTLATKDLTGVKYVLMRIKLHGATESDGWHAYDHLSLIIGGSARFSVQANGGSNYSGNNTTEWATDANPAYFNIFVPVTGGTNMAIQLAANCGYYPSYKRNFTILYCYGIKS